MSFRFSHNVRVSALLFVFAACPVAAGAQQGERIGTVQQPINAGAVVDAATQAQLGLVIVAGGCSGTLLNKYWVLTARHCVTRQAPGISLVSSPLRPADQITISAAWTRLSAQATDYYEFAVNRNLPAGQLPQRDIIMVYLGGGNLDWAGENIPYLGNTGGPPQTNRDTLHAEYATVWYAGRLADTDIVTQFGQGMATFASGVLGGTPAAVLATGLGTYRSASFNPANVSETGYVLAVNGNTQVGHGGDSGGPTMVARRGGSGVAIAGVQSTCARAGSIPVAPGTPVPADYSSWRYATGITQCNYVSVEPLVQEIGHAMVKAPVCQVGRPTGPLWCAETLIPIIDYILW